jgi:hypothetical protein
MRDQNVIKVDGVEDGIDFDARYTVRGQSGIAYWLLGWEAEQRPMICFGEDEDGTEVEIEDWSETELVRSGDNVVAVMVGDDRRWVIDKDDLTLISEDDYCHECGQVGCCANVMAS